MVPGQEIPAKIKDALARNPQGLSITDIVHETGINRNTAGRYLDKLLISGQVEMRRFGMAKIYALAHRVPISAVLSISSEYIMQLSGSLRIVFINEAFAQLLMTPAADLTGKNIEYTPFVTVFDDVYDRFIGHVKAGLEGTEWSGEYAPVHLNQVFFCRIAPTALDNGQKGVSIIIENITEKKRAEEAKNRLGRILDHSLNEIYTFDVDTLRFIDINEGARVNLGYTRTEMADMTPLDIKPEYTRESFLQLLKPLQSGKLTKQVFTTMHRRKDGSLYPVEVHIQLSRQETPPVFIAICLDISKRKEAEDALIASEERYRILAENSNDLIFMIGRDDRVEYVNTFAAGTLNKKPEDLIGKVRSGLFPEPITSFQKEMLNRVFTTGRQLAEESTLPLHGEPHWYNHLLTPVFNRDGKVQSILGVSRDITKSRQMLEDLRISEEKFRRIFEDGPLGMSIIGPDKRFTLVNRRFCEMLGYTNEEIVGKSFEEVTHPSCVPLNLENFARLYTGKLPIVHEEKQYIKKDRTTLWASITVTPLRDSGGRVISTLSIVEDITERKGAEIRLRESEKKFHDLAELLPQSVWECDSAGNLTFANRSSFTMYRYLPAALEKGLSIWQMMLPADRPWLFTLVQEAVTKPPTQFPAVVEYTAQRSDASTFPIRIYISPIVRNGTIAGMRGIGIDLTEQKRAEEAIRETGEKFQAIFDSTFQFTAMLTPEGLLTEVNRTALKFVGTRREDVIGRPFWEAGWWQGCSEEIQKLKDAIARAAAGEFVRYEVRLRGSDTLAIIADFSITPVRGPEGNVRLLIAEARDITGRRYTEDLLKESEEKFRRIFEDGPLGMVIVDSSHRFISVNRRCCEIFGYSEEELRGKTIEDVTCPDHLAIEAVEMQKIYQGKIPRYQTKKRYIKKDGSVIWGSLTVSPLRDRTGKITSTLGLVEEIANPQDTATDGKK